MSNEVKDMSDLSRVTHRSDEGERSPDEGSRPQTLTGQPPAWGWDLESE